MKPPPRSSSTRYISLEIVFKWDLSLIVYAIEMIYRISRITIEKFIINIIWWVGFAYSQMLKIARGIHSVYFIALKHLNMKSHAIKWLILKYPIKFFFTFTLFFLFFLVFFAFGSNYLLYFYLQLKELFVQLRLKGLIRQRHEDDCESFSFVKQKHFLLPCRHETQNTPPHPSLLACIVTSPWGMKVT